MDPKFWHERWEKQDTGFHQPTVHDLLQTHWAELEVGRGTSVFVPLCGKSLDMAWLAEQGHRVIGAELSELAVDEFFAGRGLEVATRTVGRFTVKSAGPYEIWCGDIFYLPHEAVEGVAAIYDRASLIAFPASMQQRYADTLQRAHAGGATDTAHHSRLRPSANDWSAVRHSVPAGGSAFCRPLRCCRDREQGRARNQRALSSTRADGAEGVRLRAAAPLTGYPPMPPQGAWHRRARPLH